MKKQLDTAAIQNELQESSVFFRQPSSSPPPVPPQDPVPLYRAPEKIESNTETTPKASSPMQPDSPPGRENSKRGQQESSASMRASKQASLHDSTPACNHASMLAKVRELVKGIGKEVAYVRLTPQEKERMLDIIYAHRRQGKKLSENDLMRIAINFMMEDYKMNGKKSLLYQALHP